MPATPFLLFVVLFSVFSATLSSLPHVRVRRDFMYVSSTNETDPDCFQRCNMRWKENFEYSLNMSLADFYEFPLHPLLLDHSSFLLYCTLAEQKTACYIHECNDQSADSVFSPSNFVCNFKRALFSEARPCLADAEPLTFLKCDQECHDAAVATTESPQSIDGADDDNNVQVFTEDELDSYERELDTLCTFQQCYVACMLPIVKQVCSPSLAARAIDVVSSFVRWHASDIFDWHVSSDRLPRLAQSCLSLAEKEQPTPTQSDDPVIQLISAA